jgi:hypothetical protein
VDVGHWGGVDSGLARVTRVCVHFACCVCECTRSRGYACKRTAHCVPVCKCTGSRRYACKRTAHRVPVCECTRSRGYACKRTVHRVLVCECTGSHGYACKRTAHRVPVCECAWEYLWLNQQRGRTRHDSRMDMGHWG